MRWLPALLLVGCTCGAVGGPDENEAAARATLGREHVTGVTLERVDERTFDFEGTREGRSCWGTVVVNEHSAAMRIDCSE